VDPNVAFPQEATRVSGRRLIAHLADGVVYLLTIVLVLPLALISDTAFAIGFLTWALLGQVPYYVLTQKRHGRTPGKALVGVRVVDENGKTPGTEALVKRTLPLLIEYFYVVALIAMMSSPYRRRLGDRWGDTYVIEDTRG
jgi:uncharacterized RDD family membrane protein YckC